MSVVKILFDVDALIHLTGGLNGGSLVIDEGEALLMAHALTERLSTLSAVDSKDAEPSIPNKCTLW